MDKIKRWHLFVAIIVLLLISLNVFQWYLNKDNHILNDKLKEKDQQIEYKLDSINGAYKDSIYKINKIIDYYKRIANKEVLNRKTNENESKKVKDNYNSLDVNERYNAVKGIIAKRLHK